MTREFDFECYDDYLKPLTEDFIRENSKIINWRWLSIIQKLSEEFIQKNSKRVDWLRISIHQPLSEAFIKKNAAHVDWEYISVYQKLSEEFIKRNSSLVDWDCISTHQKLSEEFIERNSDRVNWRRISVNQKLSEEFIDRNYKRVSWSDIALYQNLSKEFRKKHNLKTSKHNWFYADKQTKRKAIENCGLYTLDGDYIIAYKGIRSDGYSKFNFQYRYELGGIYECHADHNLDSPYSFGLSAWTEEKARDYCNEKLIKVKIHLDDVAALMSPSAFHSIRCKRLEVIGEV